ncbi:MAG: DNA polymerase IV [Acetobacteraceae bacterium]|nr:DNA polymerase IV [Acetobacteraceae bacterium]
MPAFCRDCEARAEDGARRCAGCGGHRLVGHPELFELTIAHVDCDAFYASVEKRGRPELAATPLIVGGGRRGVVAAACYVARLSGVKSAMPMFKAMQLCPGAMVVRPDMAKYVAVAREVRRMLDALTPLVLPLSIDEAVLDLAGTEALHRAPPAIVMARFAQAVEARLGITISVGLAPNRLLAKIAADFDKPRGFAVIGRKDAAAVLAERPASLLPGVGRVLAEALARKGFFRLGQLQALSPAEAARMLGEEGPALCARARGEDSRPVRAERETRSISTETTFEADLAAHAELARHLWRLCEKLAGRLIAHQLAAAGVVLKLKTDRFRLLTRTSRLAAPTVLAETLFRAADGLLSHEVDGTRRFRLIGIGAQPLAPSGEADRGDLADPEAPRRAAAERAVARIREKFGHEVIGKGRGL